MIHALPNKIMDNIFRPALVNYTKALANEVAADGVTANMILPGTFVTDRVHDSTEKNGAVVGDQRRGSGEAAAGWDSRRRASAN